MAPDLRQILQNVFSFVALSRVYLHHHPRCSRSYSGKATDICLLCLYWCGGNKREKTIPSHEFLIVRMVVEHSEHHASYIFIIPTAFILLLSYRKYYCF